MAMKSGSFTEAPSQNHSRYRSLRGKSVLPPRGFEYFRGSISNPESPLNTVRPSQGNLSRSPRPAAPMPMPTNTSAQCSKKIQEDFKSPSNSGSPSWDAASNVKNSINIGKTSKTRDRATVSSKYQGYQESQPPNDGNGTKDALEQVRKPRSTNSYMTGGKVTEAKLECAVLEVKQPNLAHNKGTSSNTNILPDKIANLEAETDKILAKQKKLVLARLQAQLITTPPKNKRRPLNSLRIFSSRSRSGTGSTQPGIASSTASALFSPASRQCSFDDSIEEPSAPRLPALKMSFIRPGSNSIGPQTNAPMPGISRDRHVYVRYRSSTIRLLVTDDTTTIDIIKATSNKTRHYLSPVTNTIIECCSVLGLERRLRQYEYVCDVMNSWDWDQQNSLLVVAHDSTKSGQNFDLEPIPHAETVPQGFSMQMYHSSTPGKWNKRCIRLFENGRICAAKSPDAQPADTTALCCLTGFDIYACRGSETRCRLNPPQKFCYAIKSQQKTTAFSIGENFVHFFSTADAQQATDFYEKIHAWRSWYLVNRMVILQRKNQVPQIAFDPNNSNTASLNRTSSTVAEREGDEPLMDVNAFRTSQIVVTEEEVREKIFSSMQIQPPMHCSKSLEKNSLATAETLKAAKEEKQKLRTTGTLDNATDKLKQQDMTSNVVFPKAVSDSTCTKVPPSLNGRTSNDVLDPSDNCRKQVRKEEKKFPEALSWFPSATEHSARLRNQAVLSQPSQQRCRPITAGVATRTSAVHRSRNPAPLLEPLSNFPGSPRYRKYPTGVEKIRRQFLGDCSIDEPREFRSSGPLRNVWCPGPPPQHAPPLPGSRLHGKSLGERA